jgi:hypothetical protein
MANTSYSIEHIFGSAPMLWEILLNCLLIWNGLSSSWAKLSELDVSYTVGDCLTLLQSMRNLQKLRIYLDNGTVEHHHFIISHPLVSLHVLETSAHRVFDHITLLSLHKLSVGKIDFEWLQSQFISCLERSSPPFQRFSLKTPEMVNDVWDNYMIQILLHIPPLIFWHLVYKWSEVDAGSFLKWLLPWKMGGGQVKYLIPHLSTISIQLDCKWDQLDYRALIEMVILRSPVARNTNPSDNICGPIEQICKVEVECSDEDEYDTPDDGMWHEEVLSILTPLWGVVDTVWVVID